MECRIVNVSSGMDEMYLLQEGETTVGRESDNDIQILKSNVSRHHARFVNMQSVCQLEDVGSVNGTFVDGDKVKSVILRNGCEIRFADEIFRFESKGSVGSDEVLLSQRNYSAKAQMDTVRIQQAKHETTCFGPEIKLPPLRRKQ